MYEKYILGRKCYFAYECLSHESCVIRNYMTRDSILEKKSEIEDFENDLEENLKKDGIRIDSK